MEAKGASRNKKSFYNDKMVKLSGRCNNSKFQNIQGKLCHSKLW